MSKLYIDNYVIDLDGRTVEQLRELENELGVAADTVECEIEALEEE